MLSGFLNSLTQLCVVFFSFFILEWILPAEKPPTRVSLWWLQVIFLVALRLLVLVFFIPVLMRLFSHPALPSNGFMDVFWPEAHPAIVLTVALFVYTFFHYWSHRLRHQVDFIWRMTHQMHHGPNRFDLSLSIYVHPFDVAFIAPVIIGSTMLVVGFSPEYFGMVGLTHILLDKPAHLNVKTPHWLGYFIYRPEQHSLHHETHNNNYGLIPLWDMIFGTFKDCEHQAERVGFPNLRPANFWDILFCKKVG